MTKPQAPQKFGRPGCLNQLQRPVLLFPETEGLEVTWLYWTNGRYWKTRSDLIRLANGEKYVYIYISYIQEVANEDF